ncbi:MAG: ABC transporter permease [Candidimonas sp.]|nr:MAG: ABC transporter permease [Candidimonas sp.]
MKRYAIGGILILVLVVVWYLATGPLGLVAAVKFPSVGDAYDSVLWLLSPGYAGASLFVHIRTSVGLVLAGFVMAIATGVPIGILMGWNELADSYLNPIFQILRPIAPIAWIPLTILWFGLGITAKIFVIWLAAFAPAVINTHTGIRSLNPTLVEAAKVLGASKRRLLWQVAVPNALPTIFAGMQISLQACWMVLVAAELVGSFTGLGHILIIATRDLNPGMIFIAMVCIAILGMLMNFVLLRIRRKVIPWRN